MRKINDSQGFPIPPISPGQEEKLSPFKSEERTNPSVLFTAITLSPHAGAASKDGKPWAFGRNSRFSHFCVLRHAKQPWAAAVPARPERTRRRLFPPAGELPQRSRQPPSGERRPREGRPPLARPAPGLHRPWLPSGEPPARGRRWQPK